MSFFISYFVSITNPLNYIFGVIPGFWGVWNVGNDECEGVGVVDCAEDEEDDDVELEVDPPPPPLEPLTWLEWLWWLIWL